MQNIVIYCHGYNSSAKTDKVDHLNSEGIETYAWDINIDPNVSIPFLQEKIDAILDDNIHSDARLVFVGTSLGAWYASRLAYVYGAKTVLINPCYSPKNLLPSIGCSVEVASKYEDMMFLPNDTVFVAQDDEVIDFSKIDFEGASFVNYVPSGGHRFNGKEFELIVNYIKQLR